MADISKSKVRCFTADPLPFSAGAPLFCSRLSAVLSRCPRCSAAGPLLLKQQVIGTQTD